MTNRTLSEADICDRFISPAIQRAGWSSQQHILREYTLRPGRVVVRGQSAFRDKASMLRADYVLFHKPNLPLAVVEAKDGCCSSKCSMRLKKNSNSRATTTKAPSPSTSAGAHGPPTPKA